MLLFNTPTCSCCAVWQLYIAI